MIYYWFHVAYLFVCSMLFWKKIDPEANLIRTRRVSILDCEGLRYMANSRYLFYMDLIRYELLFRTTLYDATARKGMFGVLGSQKIIYRRPLRRWTKFTITLVLEGWDDKWVYHRQIFEQKGQVCAIGYTKMALWKDKKAQDMNAILRESGLKTKEMKVSEEIMRIFGDDYSLLHAENVS